MFAAQSTTVINAVRSSSKTKNVSSRRSSSRSSTVKVRAMGMKKGSSIVFRNPFFLSLVFKNGCFFLSKRSLSMKTMMMMMMNKDRYRSVCAQYEEMYATSRSDRDDRQQHQRRSSWSLSSNSSVFVCRRHFFRIEPIEIKTTTTSFQKRGGLDDVNGDEYWKNIIKDR